MFAHRIATLEQAVTQAHDYHQHGYYDYSSYYQQANVAGTFLQVDNVVKPVLCCLMCLVFCCCRKTRWYDAVSWVTEMAYCLKKFLCQQFSCVHFCGLGLSCSNLGKWPVKQK